VDSLIKKVTENKPSGKILRSRSRQRLLETYIVGRDLKKINPLLDVEAALDREERKSVLKAAMVLNGPLKGLKEGHYI